VDIELVEISDDSAELDRGRRMTTFENVVIADEVGFYLPDKLVISLKFLNNLVANDPLVNQLYKQRQCQRKYGGKTESAKKRLKTAVGQTINILNDKRNEMGIPEYLSLDKQFHQTDGKTIRNDQLIAAVLQLKPDKVMVRLKNNSQPPSVEPPVEPPVEPVLEPMLDEPPPVEPEVEPLLAPAENQPPPVETESDQVISMDYISDSDFVFSANNQPTPKRTAG